MSSFSTLILSFGRGAVSCIYSRMTLCCSTLRNFLQFIFQMTFKVLNFHFSISSFRILASFSSDPVLIFIPSGARQILPRTCVKPAASIESNADARKNKKKAFWSYARVCIHQTASCSKPPTEGVLVFWGNRNCLKFSRNEKYTRLVKSTCIVVELHHGTALNRREFL